jgi:hypothetical protein
MVPIPYNSVRWVILLIGVVILALFFVLPLTVGAQFGLIFLLVLTGASWVVPPGIYGWLVRGTCPTCHGPVDWSAVNPPGEPYNEQVVAKCRNGDMTKVEFSYRT